MPTVYVGLSVSMVHAYKLNVKTRRFTPESELTQHQLNFLRVLTHFQKQLLCLGVNLRL